MTAAEPLVSLIVAARNEEAFIGRCLDSLLDGTYPSGRLEVVVVDGMSEDRTPEIVRAYAAAHPFIRLVVNPKKHATAAFNAGIRAARGDLVMFLGAHAIYSPGYVERCVRALLRSGADNVGGIWRIVPRDGTLMGEAIALASGSGFGSGDAYTKRGSRAPRLVDTVFGGCYRREVFDRIGLFDERLIRSQDFDFNLRLRRAGGTILLDPEIVCTYYVRSNLKEFWLHNLDDGFWTFYPLRYGRRTFTLRHTVPPAFVAVLAGSTILAPFGRPFGAAAVGVLGAYVLATLGASAVIAVRRRRPALLAVLPVAFAARHVGHGIGALAGLARAGAAPDTLKRAFDLAASGLALLATAPLLAGLAALIVLDSGRPVFHRGERVGQGGRAFRIFKFRTMVQNAESLGGPSTADDDPRITRTGRWLRRYKLDELPQLLNVLRGEMSLVGPRPEVPQYAALLTGEEQAILSVRPGMTDWASIWDIDEGRALAGSPDPERKYLEEIRPRKVRLQLQYVRERSLRTDLQIIAHTLLRLLRPRAVEERSTSGGPNR